MKIHVKGTGEVSLSKNSFVASGGEGSVYAKGSTAFKIYAEPRKMIPEGKIQELSNISDSNIIKPQAIIIDPVSKKPIGYTMRFIKDTYTLCQLFPRIFRDRHNIGHDIILALVRSMQKSVENVHKAGVLIVDMNELNFLVDTSFSEIYGIDVDSYQTAHYHATAIMPSVRDWKVKLGDFTSVSDWFSFAVTSFQMFIGIHPYKGKHPTVKGMEPRMQQDLSVFNSNVHLPKTCYQLDIIPEVYRSWYRAVLEDGKRVEPPTDLQAVVVVQVKPTKVIVDSDFLEMIRLFEHHQTIGHYWHHNGTGVVRGPTMVSFIGNIKNAVSLSVNDSVSVGFSPKQNHAMALLPKRQQIVNLSTGSTIPITFNAQDLMTYDGRIYVKNVDKLLEIGFHEGGNDHVLVTTNVVANIMENASTLYDGVVIQNVLGSTIASLFPESGTSYHIKLTSLDGVRVIDAKFDRGVLMMIVPRGKGGGYDRRVFRFDAEYKSYDERVVENITPSGLNFVTLETGVCLCMAEDETLEIFRQQKNSVTLQVIKDDALSGDMILTKHAGKAAFFRGNELYQLTMKAKK